MSSARPRRPPRRRRLLRRLALALVVGLAFVAGIGLGEALHDNPTAGGTQTLVQTLRAGTLAPVTRETVTVTVGRR